MSPIAIDLLEKQASLGNCGIKLEAIKGTPITPDVFIPLYSEDVTINLNIDEDNPIVGIREARYNVFRGQEDYQGVIRIMAEPKTVPHFLNMLLEKGTSTGSGTTGYTHPFTLGTPKSYTLEFLKGGIPYRFFGLEAKSITPTYENNKMVLDVAISALGQFSVARIFSASGTALVLDDSERDRPADGLTTSDTLRLYDVSLEKYEEVTISSINDDGKTITISAIDGGVYTEGDLCWLKPLTPSYSIHEPFSWGRTQFRFGTSTAAALTATPFSVEIGSNWVLLHNFENDAGAMRSGSYRPTALVRTTGDITITVKKFFKDGQEQARFLHRLARVLILRHYSPSNAGSDGTNSEIRITVNDYRISENDVPLNTGEILYNSLTLVAKYKTSETQMFDVKVVNSLDGANYE